MIPDGRTKQRFATLEQKQANPARYRFHVGAEMPLEMYEALSLMAKERNISKAQYLRMIVNHYLKSELELVGYEGW